MAETPFLTRQTQVAGKVETTAGTAETLAASNATTRVVVGAASEPDIGIEPRNLARDSLTPLGALPGEKAYNITFRTEINTPDTPTNDLEFKPFLEGVGMSIEDAKGISVGTVNNGPFTRLETIEDESGNTARLIKGLSASGVMYHEPISGTLQDAETLTGSSSGATALSSSATASYGHLAKLISNNQKTITAGLRQDGFHWLVKGAMGNLASVQESSKGGFFDFTFSGVYEDVGTQAMFSNVQYNTEQPPILQGADLAINEVSVVCKAVNFDLGNTVVRRGDGNEDDTGILSFYISGRNPKITVSFEQLPSGTLDYNAAMRAGTKWPILWQLGTVSGKNIWFFADYAQVTNITNGEVDGIATVDVEFSLTGLATSGNDEFEMMFI